MIDTDNQYNEYITIMAAHLKSLQDAVVALEPHHRRFGTDQQFNFHGKGLQCTHCDRVDGHWDSCPVTKLREVLIEQGVDDEE